MRRKIIPTQGFNLVPYKWIVGSVISILCLGLVIYAIPPQGIVAFVLFFTLVFTSIYAIVRSASKNNYIAMTLAIATVVFVILKTVELASILNSILLLGIVGIFLYFAKRHQ